MGREFEQRGGFRGGDRGGRGGGRGGDRGGRGGGRGGFGGGRPMWDQGPPASVIEVGTVMHPCQEYVVVKHTLEGRVPIFNRPIYLENKTKVGVIDDVFGPINEFVRIFLFLKYLFYLFFFKFIFIFLDVVNEM